MNPMRSAAHFTYTSHVRRAGLGLQKSVLPLVSWQSLEVLHFSMKKALARGRRQCSGLNEMRDGDS